MAYTQAKYPKTKNKTFTQKQKNQLLHDLRERNSFKRRIMPPMLYKLTIKQNDK